MKKRRALEVEALQEINRAQFGKKTGRAFLSPSRATTTMEISSTRAVQETVSDVQTIENNGWFGAGYGNRTRVNQLGRLTPDR